MASTEKEEEGFFKKYVEAEFAKKAEVTAFKSEFNALVAGANGLKPEANLAATTFNVANAEATLFKAEWTWIDLAKKAEEANARRLEQSPEQLKLRATAALDLAKELRPHVQRFMDQYPNRRSGAIDEKFSRHGIRIESLERYVSGVRDSAANRVVPGRLASADSGGTPGTAGNAEAVATHLNNLELRINDIISALGQ
ncbi:hypothetical protein AB0P36_07140 [Streptomyces flavidovirens]|uniref:hypothetical protein n=1 Tax=Streptomyces flavidovirens TaxID=67298 RepID=UPI003439F06E